jgi:glycosyltransferase involved in cell wall biosynthesis
MRSRRSSGPAAKAHVTESADSRAGDRVAVSIVLPCLNEAETVGTCVQKALKALADLKIIGEVLVVDNGSTDRSAEIARQAGAQILFEPSRGYGRALRRGLEEAAGQCIVIADADDSYDLSAIGPFIDALNNGADLVMGSRRLGKIEKGAMPWLNRRLGNPVLSGLMNLMFDSKVSDVHCGMRAVTKDAFLRMNVSSEGMEFASEMVVKAARSNMHIVDLPVVLRQDGRTNHGPHLRPLRDGWRHLRFMLWFSPTYVFFLPAVLCMLLSSSVVAMLFRGPIRLGRMRFDYHFMILASLIFILGLQLLITGLFATVFGQVMHPSPRNPVLQSIKRHFSLERGLLAGGLLFFGGFALDFHILTGWLACGMGQLNAIRPATLASTLMIAGAQIMFSSFFLSMLLLRPASE